MIVNHSQKNIKYFKEYGCYSIKTHLSQHKEFQFNEIKLIQFQKHTKSQIQLPKYLIDKQDQQEKNYWLEWQKETISNQFINQLKDKNIQKKTKLFNNTHIQQSKQMTCLYIAQLGKLAHIKFIFNYDPEMIAISNKNLYVIGAQQLIITELWPKNILQTPINMQSNPQNIKQNYIQKIHQLQNGKILSFNFILQQNQVTLCRIIYFNQNKGLFSQNYGKYKQQNQTSILEKIQIFTSKFKKSHKCPFIYQTLIPNILGLIFHNKNQFSLIDQTQLKVIQNTRTKLQGWQIDNNKPTIIKFRQNQRYEGFNNCLTISIGQSNIIELFLYHIKYKNNIIINIDSRSQSVSDSYIPIEKFSSSAVIQFEQSIFSHSLIIYLEDINELQSYVLSRIGIIYVGKKDKLEQIPHSGFIYYIQPFMTHRILMQQHKIWKQYKIDLINKNTQFQRIFIPGRYQKQFIFKILGCNNINQLIHKQNSVLTEQIQQQLVFQWRKHYKFIQFVILHGQIFIIRRNSISSLTQINQQQFQHQYDQFSQTQVNYNQHLSYGFDVQRDIQGDLLQQENKFNLSLHRSNLYEGRFRNCKSYQDKMKYLNSQQTYQDYLYENIMTFRNHKQHQQIQEIIQYAEKYKKYIGELLEIARLKRLYQPEKYDIQQQNGYQINLLQKSVLSLRVKESITIYLQNLRQYYPYFIQNQINKKNKINSNKIINNSIQHQTKLEKIRKQLQTHHFQFIYSCRILQFFQNLTTKNNILSQYQYFSQDLIDQFIDNYLRKHCQNQKIHKKYIQLHVMNILSLILKGLLTKIKTIHNPSQIIQSNIQDQIIMKQKVQEINNKNNQFLLMLLNKLNIMYQYQNGTFIKNILMSLFNGFILESLESDQLNINLFLVKLIPLSKTLVYSILQLPIQKERKKQVLNILLSSSDGLDLLILIQTENNLLYEIQSYQHLFKNKNNKNNYYNKVQQFIGYKKLSQSSYKLSFQNAFLIQELILQKSQIYLFQSKQLSNQSLSHVLYKNIQFNFITINQRYFKNYNNNENNENISKMMNKLNRYLIQQQYNILRKDINIVQNVFSKYYKKIYYSKFNKQKGIKKQSNKLNKKIQVQGQKISQYDKQEYKLSFEQLNEIQRLYRKYQHEFRKTNNIQEKINLQYAMLKIYLFRFKFGCKQLQKIKYQIKNRQQYVKILKQCLDQIKQSAHIFRNNYPKLYTFNQQSKYLTNQEFIDILNTSSSLEKCNDLSIQYQIDQERNQKNKSQWVILGYPINQEWLDLIELTFYRLQDEISFFNYHNFDSILMKIIKMIFTFNYVSRMKNLIKTVTLERIEIIIKANQQLNTLFKKNVSPQIRQMFQKNDSIKINNN